MKRLLILGLGVLFAFSFLSATVVFAVGDSESSTTTTTETEKTLAERIAERKAELKTKLTNAEKTRLQAKCKAAQGLVSSVSGRVKGIETSRTQVHKNLINRLTSLSEKLKNKGVDTTELNADIATLQTKIDSFNTDLTTYKQAVSDLAEMDCKTDPDGFKASLEAARAAREKVTQDSLAIRGYVNDTIKPLLKTIRAQLEADKTEGNQ